MKSIPFREQFRGPILCEDKTYTARTKPYGKPGEILMTGFGFPIELLSVKEKTLGWISENLWQKEGVSGPQEFERIWRELHGDEFEPDRLVWLHHFRLYKAEVWV